MAENAFTLLTLIAGPAVLTNACSVLALSTGNRYGRAFDRAREIGLELEHAPPQGQDGSRLRLLERLIERATMLLRAQTAFFAAIALFVLSAVVSLVGAAVSQEIRAAWAPVLPMLVLFVGLLATAFVIKGCALTVRETRLALVNLREEHELLARRAVTTDDLRQTALDQ
jgi:hypothetical protein